MLTFADCKTAPIANVAGVDPSSLQFADYVNEAIRRLLKRGDFNNTVVPIHVCIKSGCVVWPRYVDQVRKINLCNRPLPLNNLWYDWLNMEDRSLSHWNGLLVGGSNCRMDAYGRSPVFNDVAGEGRLIRAYAEAFADVGRNITIFGEDNNGQPLMTKNPDGTWAEGITLTFTNPWASTSIYVRRIDRVIKDVTQKRVRLYAYNPVNDLLEDIAYYDPTETNPEYARYRIHAPSWPQTTTPGSINGGPSNCCPTFGVTALVKLKFIPVVADTDLVIVDQDAIKDMIQAIRFGESGDYAKAAAGEAKAIREANRELENANPDAVIPVENNVFGSFGIGRQSVF
jgi:hypothetical protein